MVMIAKRDSRVISRGYASNAMQRGACFFCGEVGHFKDMCPSKEAKEGLPCQYCGIYGHAESMRYRKMDDAGRGKSI